MINLNIHNSLIVISFFVNLNTVTRAHYGSFLHLDNSIPDDIKKEFPYISCPLVFDYVENIHFGGYFGLISLPNPLQEDEITLDVDMSYNGMISILDNLKLNVLSTDEEVISSKFLQWAVLFPFQENYPKIISIKLNGKRYCTSYPDPVVPDVKQTTLWAKSTIIKEKSGDDQTVVTKSKRTMPGNHKQPQTNYLPGVPVSNPHQKDFLMAIKKNDIYLFDLAHEDK